MGKETMMKNLVVMSLILGLTSSFYAQQTWQRNYGGVDTDYGWSVQQTLDGGYIIAGYTNSFGSSFQVYLVKTDASGDTLWTRTYGAADNDYGYSVRQTKDSGYIVAGGLGADVWLIKTDAAGDTLWTRTYGGVDYDNGRSVQQTQDSGYIVAGNTYSFGNGGQVYLVKTDAAGDTLWTRTYGGPGDDGGLCVQQTQDMGYIVAGRYDWNGGDPQVYLVKTSASGDTIWTRTIGGVHIEEGYSVQQTQDLGYIITGHTSSFGGDQLYLVKTNASGDTLWTSTFGADRVTMGYSVQQTQDSGYIVVGETYSLGDHWEGYIIKTNASGDSLLWTRTYGGAGNSCGYSVQQTADSGYVVAGTSTTFGNGDQVYLVRIDGNGNIGIEEAAERGAGAIREYGATPNPFASHTKIPGHGHELFVVYDIAGKLVGSGKGDCIGQGLAPGVYLVGPSEGVSRPLRIVKVSR